MHRRRAGRGRALRDRSLTALRARPGTAADCEICRRIEARAAARFAEIGMADLAAPRDEDLSPAAILRARAEAGGLFLVEWQGEPVGFARAEPVDGLYYLEEIDVVPEAAGRGAGAALLRAVEARAAAEKRPAVTLATFRDVPWNAPWYARQGYREWHEARRAPGHDSRWRMHEAIGLDMARRLFMRKDLAAPPC